MSENGNGENFAAAYREKFHKITKKKQMDRQKDTEK